MGCEQEIIDTNNYLQHNMFKCAIHFCQGKSYFLLFQNASTKILLYFIATGQTVQSSSNAPCKQQRSISY